MANLKSTTISDTGFLQLPTGTTAQRPSSPSAGEIRFNTDTKVCEWYDDQLDSWFPTGFVPPVATGGDTVEDVDINGVTYRIHSFTTVGSSNFTVTRGGPVDFLIVAGGGGGGVRSGTGSGAGGGGAGGLLTGVKFLTAGIYTIVIGDGGTSPPKTSNSRGENGTNSSAFGFNAVGGGGGGAYSSPADGLAGGSGGGAGRDAQSTRLGGQGTPGQGNNGANGSITNNRRVSGGGGGAGLPGKQGGGDNSEPQYGGGQGGDGIISNMSGAQQFYAGGGGGGSYGGVLLDNGGLGGGGRGGSESPSIDGASGVPNTGGGGGAELGNGGSGIVIIRYRIS